MTKDEIQKSITENKIVLFIKGVPQAPACGFSHKVCLILNALDVDFTSFNVLEDDTLRQNIKEYSEWPTIPQLYVDGEFVGGCDIVMDMYQDGSLKELIEDENAKT